MMAIAARFACHFANAVVSDQPTVFSENWRSSSADLKTLPGRHRSRQPVMQRRPNVVQFRALQRGGAVGNPNTLVIKVHFMACMLGCNFLWTSAGKSGRCSIPNSRCPAGLGIATGKKARVLVVHGAQI